jgi:hypothetical protein
MYLNSKFFLESVEKRREEEGKIDPNCIVFPCLTLCEDGRLQASGFF